MIPAAGLCPRVVSRRSLRRQYGWRLRRTFVVDSNGLMSKLVRAYAPGMATESSVPPGALAFSRGSLRLHTGLVKGGGLKGQLLLTLNGIYNRTFECHHCLLESLIKLHTSLPPATWFLLAGAAVATAISILMAIACLYSRLSDARLDEIRDSFTERDAHGNLRYQPAAHWFGTIARANHDTGLKMLQSADQAFELSAVTEDLFLLASKVLAKHRWVNKGWVAAGASLLLLLAAAVSAVIAT